MAMMKTTVRCENCGRTNRIPAAADGRPKCGNCGAPLPWIVEAGDSDFTDIVERSPMVVLVDMWAPWCGPCRTVTPVLELLAREHAGTVKLVKVNVDDAPGLSQRFSVRAVPTLMVMYRGEVTASQPGAAPAPALRAWLQQAMAGISTSQQSS